MESVGNGELENLYNIIGRIENYVNYTMDGMLSWHNISSCTLYFDEALEE